MKKSKSKEARRKKLYNKLIQTAMIHEAVFGGFGVIVCLLEP